MIRRIILENYMSHARTVIEPAAGLTVLSGPNNCGKSAIISALLSLRGDCDQSGDFMVRHGEKQCAVTVETDDRHVVTWQRKKGAVSYILDGVEIPRMGRNTPDQLPQMLRLPLIEPSNTDKCFDLHFGLQKEPIFLIDSPGDAARFFSASNDAERLLQMQQLQKERVRTARGDERRTRAEINRVESKLAALGPLDELEPELKQIEAEYGALADEAKQIERLRAVILRLQQCELEQQRLSILVERLSSLKPLPSLVPVKPLVDLADKLKEVLAAAGMHTASVSACSELAEPPAVLEIAPLRLLVRQMAGAQCAVADVAAARASLAALRDPPTPMDIEPTRQFIKQWNEAQRIVDRRRIALKKSAAELQAVETRIDEWVQENPTCPICGGETDRDRLLETGEHVHA